MVYLNWLLINDLSYLVKIQQFVMEDMMLMRRVLGFMGEKIPAKNLALQRSSQYLKR
jgi:hypothetical protein